MTTTGLPFSREQCSNVRVASKGKQFSVESPRMKTLKSSSNINRDWQHKRQSKEVMARNGEKKTDRQINMKDKSNAINSSKKLIQNSY